MHAIAPRVSVPPAARPDSAVDALDLFGKAQDVSLDGLNLPDGFTDDGNWEELGVPAVRADDYLEFDILTPCLVACANCSSVGDGIIRIDFMS